MDLSRTIERLGGSESFCVERRAKGQLVNGRHVRAEATTFNAEGAIQNSDADTIAMLPEGVRKDASITIWTTTQLRTAEDDVAEADRVTARGVVWEVHQVKTWEREGNFFRAVCVKVGQ
jgi:hypothetical protein